MNLEQAIKVLCQELVTDNDYWQTWVSNIAMAFQDEFYQSYLHEGIHEISNNAAKRFLENLCSIGEK